MKYIVRVDENSHYMDESERYTLGEYETAEAAIAAAKQVVNNSLRELHDAGMDADSLCAKYRIYGDDPFIISDDPNCKFSAWNYARERCEEICR